MASLKKCGNCYKKPRWFIKTFGLIFCKTDRKIHRRNVERKGCSWFWPIDSGLGDQRIRRD